MILRRFTQHIKEQNWFAVGLEVAILVVGIFLGMQVTDWNEQRNQSRAELEFITSVKKDLKQDKAFIQFVIERLNPRLEAYNKLNADIINLYHNDRKQLEFLFKRYFTSQRTFYPISDTYESAISGNQLTIYKNKNLIQKLIKLYNSTYVRLIDNGYILDKRWAFLSKKYSHERRTGQFREMSDAQLTEFLDDLFHHYVQMVWYLEQLKTAQIEVNELIKILTD